MERSCHEKWLPAYLTVFVTLSMAAILSVILVLLQGAQVNAARLKTVCACDIAADSALSEFNRALYDQYDLFFIDTSYLSGEASVEKTESHLEEYLEKNIEPSGLTGLSSDLLPVSLTESEITGSRFAADERGRPVREQVYAYMSADAIGSVTAPALAIIDKWKGLPEFDVTGWQTKKAESERALQESLNTLGYGEAGSETGNSETGSGDIYGRISSGEGSGEDSSVNVKSEKTSITMEGLQESLDLFHNTPILNQIYGNRTGSAALSDRKTDTDALISHRDVHTGNASGVENSHQYPEADEIVFDEYIMEKCDDISSENSEEKNAKPLRYEVEYILYGKDRDKDNLEAAALRLVLLREAVNGVCLFADASRRKQAETAALVISTLLLSPELADVLTPVILFSWAYVESLQDVRILLDGGTISPVKTKDQWRTPIYKILMPYPNARAKSDQGGWSYEDYLRIFLYLENSRKKTFRLMDVMEMNIRQTEGNKNFQLDWCMDMFRMKVETQTVYGQEITCEKEASYN